MAKAYVKVFTSVRSAMVSVTINGKCERGSFAFRRSRDSGYKEFIEFSKNFPDGLELEADGPNHALRKIQDDYEIDMSFDPKN